MNDDETMSGYYCECGHWSYHHDRTVDLPGSVGYPCSVDGCDCVQLNGHRRGVSNDLHVIGVRQLSDSLRWHPDLAYRPWRAVARHFAMGLAEEAGEVLGIFKKLDRGDFTWADLVDASTTRDPARRAALIGELADVTMYLTALATLLDVDLGEAVVEKAAMNDVRFGRGTGPT